MANQANEGAEFACAFGYRLRKEVSYHLAVVYAWRRELRRARQNNDSALVDVNYQRVSIPMREDASFKTLRTALNLPLTGGKLVTRVRPEGRRI